MRTVQRDPRRTRSALARDDASCWGLPRVAILGMGGLRDRYDAARHLRRVAHNRTDECFEHRTRVRHVRNVPWPKTVNVTPGFAGDCQSRNVCVESDQSCNTPETTCRRRARVSHDSTTPLFLTVQRRYG